MLVVIFCGSLIVFSSAQGAQQLKSDPEGVLGFIALNQEAGTVTDIQKQFCLSTTIPENTKIQFTFPPANKELVDSLGADPIPMIEEDTVLSQLEIYDLNSTGVLESFSVDGDGNQVALFQFENLAQNTLQSCMHVRFRNVMLPCIQRRVNEGSIITMEFKDASDVTFHEAIIELRSSFAKEFESQTKLIQSGDSTLKVSLKVPYGIPAGVYFKLIKYPGSHPSAESITYTCTNNCGSSPTITVDESEQVIMIENFLDANVPKKKTIKFELSGIERNTLTERSVYYYQIGFDGDALLEGQGSFGSSEDVPDLGEIELTCNICASQFATDTCDYDEDLFTKVTSKFFKINAKCAFDTADSHFPFMATDTLVIELPNTFAFIDNEGAFARQVAKDSYGTFYTGDYSFDYTENSLSITNFKTLQYLYAYDEDSGEFNPSITLYFGFVSTPGFLARSVSMFSKAKLYVYDEEGELVGKEKIKIK